MSNSQFNVLFMANLPPGHAPEGGNIKCHNYEATTSSLGETFGVIFY